MYVFVEKKNIVYMGFGTICGFRYLLGGLGMYPRWIRGTTVLINDRTLGITMG